MTAGTLPPIPAAYIERAARAYYDTAGVHWDTLATSDQEAAAACLTAAIEAFLQLAVPEMLEAAMHTARGLVAEEIAQAIERCEDDARRVEEIEGVAGNKGAAKTWFDLAGGYMRAAELAREIGSRGTS